MSDEKLQVVVGWGSFVLATLAAISGWSAAIYGRIFGHGHAVGFREEKYLELEMRIKALESIDTDKRLLKSEIIRENYLAWRSELSGEHVGIQTSIARLITQVENLERKVYGHSN